ncbi:Bifunctional epoxide hydrolase 2 [Pseudocercospora fuligena]|uniref:Bifunctional epoxide hydrolase 2 n=1 Tax=Pseudocercospora fuligena TaxID=685502 RepID=A0A8H6RM41_9PEZI|nr:Bifunctional epoxide hydrolase 2 [Pseudocercospora fuligena]
MFRSLGLLLHFTLLVASRAINITTPGLVPGTTSHYAQVGGHTYYYMRSRPAGEYKGTIFLFHGYPDFSYGWRNQIPYLTSLGYQVIAPDMLGYSETDSPKELSQWAKKKLSADMAQLADQIVPGEQIIVGGHDWGVGIAYKMPIWYPDLVKAFFTVSVPYAWVFKVSGAPYVDLSVSVENGTYPLLGYQLQWRDFAWERNFQSRAQIRDLLNGMYGGLTQDNQSAFSPYNGYDLDQLPTLQPTQLVNSTTLDIYVENFAKQGFRGPDNWYRVYQMDWEDERPIADRAESVLYTMPALFLGTSLDAIFPKSSWANMSRYFDNLTIDPLEAGHWVLWEQPDAANEILGRWLNLTVVSS